MSDTPRTDKAEAESIKAYADAMEAGWPAFPCDGYDFARELERENAKLREALIRRHKEQCYPMPDYTKEALNMSNGKKTHE